MGGFEPRTAYVPPQPPTFHHNRLRSTTTAYVPPQPPTFHHNRLRSTTTAYVPPQPPTFHQNRLRSTTTAYVPPQPPTFHHNRLRSRKVLYQLSYQDSSAGRVEFKCKATKPDTQVNLIKLSFVEKAVYS